LQNKISKKKSGIGFGGFGHGGGSSSITSNKAPGGKVANKYH